VGLLGLWLAIAAFIPGLRDGAGLLWNNLIVGIAVAIAAFSIGVESKWEGRNRRCAAGFPAAAGRVANACASSRLTMDPAPAVR
jgi:hypothetical protein